MAIQGTRGKPKSTERRRAEGQRVPVLPVLAGGRPTAEELAQPPAGLDSWAQAAWSEVAQQLVDSKLIDRVDRHALEAYALHMGRARALREAIEWEHYDTCQCPDEEAEEPAHREGCRLGQRKRRRSLEQQFMARTARGFTSNPLLSQEREALREARMMGELLGLNPVGRTRLQGGKNAPKGAGLGALTADLPPLHVLPDAVGEP